MNFFHLIVFVGVIVIVGLFLLWHFGKRPYKHKKIAQEDFEKYFTVLLNRGFNAGFLVIEVPRSALFIQFSKYIGQTGNVGLQFDFPRVLWSENYYESVKSEASRNGFQFSLERGSDHIEFITIDLNHDIARAVILAKLILQSVFKLDPNTKLDLRFGNVSPKDEKIGF